MLFLPSFPVHDMSDFARKWVDDKKDTLQIMATNIQETLN